MKKYYLFMWVAAVSLLFLSCHKNDYVLKAFGEAAELMNERPDSSLNILEDIDPALMQGRRMEAEYSLLLSMALDKNCIDWTSDSLINIAVDYFRFHKDHEKRFRSLYYQGRVYENAGQYNKAMRSFTEAEQMIGDVDDDMAKGLLYAHLGDIYGRFYNYQKSLESYEKSEHFHAGAENTAHQYYSKLSMGCAYINLNQFDKAERLLKEVLEWGHDNDSSAYAAGRRLLGTLYMHAGDSAGYMMLFEDGDADVWATDCSVRAYRDALRNRKMAALDYLNQGWKSAESLRDTLNMYRCAYGVHKHLGDFETALAEHEKLLFAQDTAVRAAMRQPLLEVQKEYFHSLALNRELELKNNRIIFMGGGVITVLMMILLIIYYRGQLMHKQKNLDDYIEWHHELEKLLSDRNNVIVLKDLAINERDKQIDTVHAQMRNLFSHQYELLNQLCKIFYENPGSSKKNAVYSEVKKEIELFKSDKDFLNKLEQIVNEYNNDVMRKLKEGMPMLSSKDFNILCFYYAGFSAKAISLFTDETIGNIYVKKKRLKDRIQAKRPQGWEDMLSCLEKHAE